MNELVDYFVKFDNGKSIALIGIVMWIDIRGTVKRMADSLSTLTVQLATVVERVDSHEKRIDRLEDGKK